MFRSPWSKTCFQCVCFAAIVAKKPSSTVSYENKQDICSMLSFWLCFCSGDLCAHVRIGGTAFPSLSQPGCKVVAILISRALFLAGVLQTAVIQSRSVLKNVYFLQHVAKEPLGKDSLGTWGKWTTFCFFDWCASVWEMLLKSHQCLASY